MLGEGPAREVTGGMSQWREVLRFQVPVQVASTGFTRGSGCGVAAPCGQRESIRGDCHAFSLGIIRTEKPLAAKGGWEGRERHFGDAKSEMSGGRWSGGVQQTVG